LRNPERFVSTIGKSPNHSPTMECEPHGAE
jgi:hypothetical protein